MDPAYAAKIGVNIDDLLVVINDFNNTFAFGDLPPSFDEAAGKPQGDIVSLPCGNWVVNIDDLLAVINAFGDCP